MLFASGALRKESGKYADEKMEVKRIAIQEREKLKRETRLTLTGGVLTLSSCRMLGGKDARSGG